MVLHELTHACHHGVLGPRRHPCCLQARRREQVLRIGPLRLRDQETCLRPEQREGVLRRAHRGVLWYERLRPLRPGRGQAARPADVQDPQKELGPVGTRHAVSLLRSFAIGSPERYHESHGITSAFHGHLVRSCRVSEKPSDMAGPVFRGRARLEASDGPRLHSAVGRRL